MAALPRRRRGSPPFSRSGPVVPGRWRDSTPSRSGELPLGLRARNRGRGRGAPPRRSLCPRTRGPPAGSRRSRTYGPAGSSPDPARPRGAKRASGLRSWRQERAGARAARRPTDAGRAQARSSLVNAKRWNSSISAVLAVIAGYLVFEESFFGTPKNFAAAFIWAFGIDASIEVIMGTLRSKLGVPKAGVPSN